ncbi:MAG: sensor histidine kinase [Brachybacterium tyrofermentans]
MTGETDGGHQRRAPRSVWARAMAMTAEILLLALLLAVDFELGMHFMVPDPGIEDIGGALTTALVAIIAAALVLARKVLPPRVTAAAVFSVSLLASALSVWTGHISLSLTETGAVVVATMVGIRGESSSRSAIVLGAAAFLVSLAAVLLRIDAGVSVVLLAALIWGCAVTVGIAGRYIRSRREFALESARRAERMELARELHDVVAHQVSGIVVQAQAAIVVARKDPERVTEALSAIEGAGTEALSGMRRMVGTIRDGTERDAPLTVPYGLADIPALVDSFDPGRERTTLRLEASDASLPAGIGESAYRIVREALTNVRRHAPEGSTRICVRVIGTDLVLGISNDGVRARAVDQGPKGFGLTGMAERVSTLGGSLHAGPGASGTWNVRASLPVDTVR